MKINKGLLYVGVIVICVIIIWLVLIPSSYLLNKDVSNATLEGFVYNEKGHEPLGNVEIKIENWIYEGGDYDGYGKQENYTIYTDNNGHFALSFLKSAFLVVYAKKTGFLVDTLSKETSHKVELNIFLKSLDK